MSKRDFSAKVKQREKEEAGGVCRICFRESITQYHHITEKGMGGGRGTGLQINCLGVGESCHNHDNTIFLRKADKILRQRVDRIFPGRMDEAFSEAEITCRLEAKKEVEHGMNKGSLKYRWHRGERISTKEEILRWLEGR